MWKTGALEQVRHFAREWYAGLDFAHGPAHGERVVALARRIQAEEGGDPFLVEAGAWLHQLHDEPAALDALLDDLDLAAPRREHLAEIVRDCRPERIATTSSLEARIVFDADALELLGPWGTVRELLCNAKARGKDWQESVADTRAVQARFQARLATATGRRFAAAACAVADSFWNAYDRWARLEL